MRKVHILLTCFLTAALLLSGCGGKSAEPSTATPAGSSDAASALPPEIQTIYEAAKKEGKISYWAPDEAEISSLREAFGKMFPGIEVELFYTQPPKALEKMITEANANQTNVDVFISYYNDMNLVLDRDLAQTVDWNKTFGIDPSLIHFDNRGVLIWNNSIPLVYNTSLVKEDEVPKSWEDLKDPKWKGKILLESRGNAFPILSYVWGEEKTINYVKELMELDPIIIQGGEPTMQAIATGQASLGIGTYAYKVKPMQEKGATVEWAKFGPIPVISLIAGVAKDAPHPNAAKLWTYFMTTNEGLEARLAAGGSERLDGPVSGPRSKLLKEKNIDIIKENPDKKESAQRVETEVKKLLSSLKK